MLKLREDGLGNMRIKALPKMIAKQNHNSWLSKNYCVNNNLINLINLIRILR